MKLHVPLDAMSLALYRCTDTTSKKWIMSWHDDDHNYLYPLGDDWTFSTTLPTTVGRYIVPVRLITEEIESHIKYYYEGPTLFCPVFSGNTLLYANVLLPALRDDTGGQWIPPVWYTVRGANVSVGGPGQLDPAGPTYSHRLQYFEVRTSWRLRAGVVNALDPAEIFTNTTNNATTINPGSGVCVSSFGGIHTSTFYAIPSKLITVGSATKLGFDWLNDDYTARKGEDPEFHNILYALATEHGLPLSISYGSSNSVLTASTLPIGIQIQSWSSMPASREFPIKVYKEPVELGLAGLAQESTLESTKSDVTTTKNDVSTTKADVASTKATVNSMSTAFGSIAQTVQNNGQDILALRNAVNNITQALSNVHQVSPEIVAALTALAHTREAWLQVTNAPVLESSVDGNQPDPDDVGT